MTARGRFVARLVTMLIALAGFVTVGALPAAADNSGTVQYVALGDSYAAGQGGGDYLNDCKESPNGYPYLLDSKMRIDLRANAACTGKSTSEVRNSQLSELTEETGLVTLTVGAADLGLSGVLAACTAGTPAQCQEALRLAGLLLPVECGAGSELGRLLGELYADVVKAAPNALIVATGYPLLFELVQGDPDLVLKTQINDATTGLNCAIDKAVADAQAANVNIVYVDVTAEFAGHGIGSKKPFIHDRFIDNDPSRPDPDAFHPNAAGYRAYAKAIFAAIRSLLDENEQVA